MKMTLINKLRRPLRIDAACFSDKGRVRVCNEDNYYFDGSCAAEGSEGTEGVILTSSMVQDSSASKGSLFAVFDGIGGSERGEAASHAAANEAASFVREAKDMDLADIPSSMERLYQRMDRSVSRKADALGAGDMGTTAASAYFFGGRAWCSNLGDSRCYLLRDGNLSLLSEDHTDTDALMMFGISGSKPPLTRYLGAGSISPITVPSQSDTSVQRGDTFLICTDGITDMLSDAAIGEILSTSQGPAEAAGRLGRAANEKGGRDNLTAIVIQAK